ncbi:MAG: MFS transporter [Gammaproteobacteria bacterium]|nr:MFS transporter [Gammaproteobacteria bacterium]MDH5274300.1 MFS transporter [Gammaproteobacteria bacterium]
MAAAARPEAADGGVGTTMQRWYVLLMMVLVYTLSIADRYVISTVLEPIRLELQLTDSGIAFLTGVSLALFYVVLGFPISWLIDRGNRRNIIAVCLIAWSVMTAFCGLSKNYIQLLLSRIGVGIGEAGGTPGANSIISDYFPQSKRPMALTVFSLGAPIGAWIGADIAGIVNDHYNWRTVFLVLGIPGVIVGLLIFFTVREPRRGQLDKKGGDDKGASFPESMRFLWTQRSAVHVMTASALTALWGWGLMWWTPTYLIRNFGLTPGAAGSILGPVHLIGGGLATLATSWWLAQPSMKDPRKIVRMMGWGVGIATLVSGVIYSTQSLELARWLFWLFIPAIYFYIGPCFGLLNNLCEPRMRAQFCAATLFVANVGNLIVAPQLVGFLSDAFAPNHVANGESLRLAMLCLVPVGAWATWHYFRSAKRIVQDEEHATGIRPA